MCCTHRTSLREMMYQVLQNGSITHVFFVCPIIFVSKNVFRITQSKLGKNSQTKFSGKSHKGKEEWMEENKKESKKMKWGKEIGKTSTEFLNWHRQIRFAETRMEMLFSLYFYFFYFFCRTFGACAFHALFSLIQSANILPIVDSQ